MQDAAANPGIVAKAFSRGRKAILHATLPLARQAAPSEVALISLVSALLMAAQEKSSVHQSYRVAVNIIIS